MDKYINQIVLIQVDKDNAIPFVGEKGQIVAIKQYRNADTDNAVIPIPYDVVFNSHFGDKRFYAEEETVLVSEE